MTTQQTKAVDWGKPIEAVHEDGRVVAAVVSGGPDRDGDYRVDFDGRVGMYVTAEGRVLGCNWRIRNVAEVGRNTDAPTNEVRELMETVDYRTYSPTPTVGSEVSDRLNALCRRMERRIMGGGVPAEVQEDYMEARAIVALFDPVDGDEAEIQKLLADFRALGSSMTKGQRARSLASAALARGRALAEAGK